MPFPNQRFHLSPKKPKPGVAVHGLLLAMQLASANCSNDLLPCQPELLLRRFVADGRALTAPLGIHVVHSTGSLLLILPSEGQCCPAFVLGYFGMWSGLG